MIIDATPDEVVRAFEETGKTVVTFSGYSGTGYENEAAMLDAAREVLARFDPSRTLVNIGGTVDGIGAVYGLARSLGFETTGIVSTQARAYEADLSPECRRVYFIEDPSWGGLVEGENALSPTSTTMVEVSDLYVAIGGGTIARDELIGARVRGKETRFIPADMNHRIARERAESRGQEPPTDFRGAAHQVFGPEG